MENRQKSVGTVSKGKNRLGCPSQLSFCAVSYLYFKGLSQEIDRLTVLSVDNN
jgi:hypothetical protein